MCSRRWFFATFALNFINKTATPLPLLFEFFSRRTHFFLASAYHPRPISILIYISTPVNITSYSISLYIYEISVCVYKHPPKRSCFIIVYNIHS